jgi:hypothetical protein
VRAKYTVSSLQVFSNDLIRASNQASRLRLAEAAPTMYSLMVLVSKWLWLSHHVEEHICAM